MSTLHGHWWTLQPRLRRLVRGAVVAPAEPWELVVDDERVGPVRLTGHHQPVAGADELVVILHGISGSANAPYAVAAADTAARCGIASLRLNLRGADRLGEDFYHAGLTSDLDAVLAAPELAGYDRLYLVGYSLGGHLALRYATETPDARVAAVAALCSPLDLASSGTVLDSPFLWPYRYYVVRGLLDIYKQIAERGKSLPLPLAEALKMSTLRQWDDLVVAPRHGFVDADDYRARVSVAPRLSRLAVPALLVAAEHDPMIPAATIRPHLAGTGGLIEVRWLEQGGHLGFPPGVGLGTDLAGLVDLAGDGGDEDAAANLDAQVLAWLRRASDG